MNFQECCEQVIFPTFERLKKRYESEHSLGCEGLIDAKGDVRSLSIQNPKEKEGWWWTIAFVPDEGSEGTATAFHAASSDGEIFQLMEPYQNVAINKLTPGSIEVEAKNLMRRVAHTLAEHKRRWPDSYK